MVGIGYNASWSFGDVMQVVVPLLAGVILWMAVWFYRRVKLRHPFRADSDDGKALLCFRGEPNDEKPQQWNVTLRMNLQVNVEHIQVLFDGEGANPQIGRLFDWQRFYDDAPTGVGLSPLKDGSMYWEYVAPKRRPKNSRITIGVEFNAPQEFVGSLKFRMTILEHHGSAREIALPITIQRRSTLDKEGSQTQ